MLIPIQLFIVIICHFCEFSFILWFEHGYTVSSKIRASHGHNMSTRFIHYAMQDFSEPIVLFVSRYMMKFIDCNECLIKFCFINLFTSEAESCMCAYKYLSITFHKPQECLYFACIASWSTEIVFWKRIPICEESFFCEFSKAKRTTD